MTLTSPIGPSVYVIFLLIDSFAFPPISCAEDADDTFAIREPDRENAFAHATQTEVARLLLAVRHILRNHAQGVGKCVLRQAKGDAVLFPVLPVFLGIPFEFTVDRLHTLAR